ncbi:hypothetical protein GCM10017673_38580 [Streptosporangium violaceochromogenes]|nr:hypothetical protein GCM10017673_38580 [Streptosporangium violaceochromogenes]
MLPEIGAHYVLHQDGLWMYYLPDTLKPDYGAKGDVTAHADGQPMTKLLKPGWWGSTHQVREITVHVPQWPRVAGYTLDDPAAKSERFPTSLTAEKYRELAATSDIWAAMYSAVRDSVPDAVLTLTGPWTVLEDAAPPPADAPRPWHATLPTLLTQRPEYAHLFPGELRGFRKHMVTLIEALPYVKYVFNEEQIKVTLEVPLELPQDEWVTPFSFDGRRKPKPVRRQITVTRRLTLPIGDRIGGLTRADAEHAWDEQAAHWAGVVTAASAKACSHCRGTGHVADGSTAYDTKKTP